MSRSDDRTVRRLGADARSRRRRCSVDGATRSPMTRERRTAGGPADAIDVAADATASTTATCSTTTTGPLPDPRSRWQPDGVHGLSRDVRPERVRLDRRATGPGRQLAGGVIYELHIGTFTPDGHARRRRSSGSTTSSSSASTSSSCCRSTRFNGTHELGLRRRALVRRPRDLRRPGRLPALRRRLPRARARRDPGRRLQPPRPERQLPARVRPVPRATATRTPGAPSINLDGPTPTRCAATSSTTR